MAKRGYWTKARRAAFAKMRAGLSRSRRKVVRRRRGRHVYVSPLRGRGRAVRRRRYYRNPLAVIANPGALGRYDPVFAASQQRRKPKMARKRRKSRRRVARRRGPARRRRYTRRPSRSRRRYYPRRRRSYGRRRHGGRAVIYVNPRRRRRRFRRHRRNPGFLGGGILRAVFAPFAAGFVASAAMVGVDKMLANSPRLAQLAKVGAAFVVAFAGRRYPRASCAAIGAIGASVGYPTVTRLLGGMSAQTPAQAVTGLGAMTATYPAMGALLSGGVGALLSGMGDAPSNLPNVANNYMAALRNNVSGDDD